LKTFGEMLAWFGPLGTGFIDRITDTLSQPWFHGDSSTQESEDKLNGQPKGTFLIRFSTSTPGCYTISNINSKKKLVHQRVVHIPGEGFRFWDVTFPDLHSLIKSERKKYFFVQPCPGSKYKKLFPKKEKKKNELQEVDIGGYMDNTTKK